MAVALDVLVAGLTSRAPCVMIPVRCLTGSSPGTWAKTRDPQGTPPNGRVRLNDGRSNRSSRNRSVVSGVGRISGEASSRKKEDGMDKTWSGDFVERVRAGRIGRRRLIGGAV